MGRQNSSLSGRPRRGSQGPQFHAGGASRFHFDGRRVRRSLCGGRGNEILEPFEEEIGIPQPATYATADLNEPSPNQGAFCLGASNGSNSVVFQNDDSGEPPQSPLRLDQIQRWLQAVIMHPEGVSAGIESRRHARKSTSPPTASKKSSIRRKRRTSVERIEVYTNAYYARLLECLRDEFSRLAACGRRRGFRRAGVRLSASLPLDQLYPFRTEPHFAQFLEETRPTEDQAERPRGPTL